MHQSRSRRDQNQSVIALTVKLFESLTPGDLMRVEKEKMKKKKEKKKKYRKHGV